MQDDIFILTLWLYVLSIVLIGAINMVKVALVIAGLILPSFVFAAIDCEIRPDHPKCQPDVGGGDLVVYDANGVAVGPFVASETESAYDGLGERGVFNYEYTYQGQAEIVQLVVSRDYIQTRAPINPYYADANCQGFAWVQDSGALPIDSTLFQPSVVSATGRNNEHGPAASWLFIATGVRQANVNMVARRFPSAQVVDGVLYPAMACLPVIETINNAVQLEFLTDLYSNFTPPFEVR
ncbi:hypothetical protein ACFL3Y_01360 [Pseudomonadota bacterium]